MTRQMQPPLRQPIGFWTTRAGEAIRRRTRSRLQEIGVSQPEWWLLQQLSLHPAGVDDHTMIATIGPNDTDQAIVDAIAAAIEKEWIRRDGDRLLLTPTGDDIVSAAGTIQQELADERRQGISDADYETAIRVMQRTIANVGGDAWHW